MPPIPTVKPPILGQPARVATASPIADQPPSPAVHQPPAMAPHLLADMASDETDDAPLFSVQSSRTDRIRHDVWKVHSPEIDEPISYDITAAGHIRATGSTYLPNRRLSHLADPSTHPDAARRRAECEYARLLARDLMVLASLPHRPADVGEHPACGSFFTAPNVHPDLASLDTSAPLITADMAGLPRERNSGLFFRPTPSGFLVPSTLPAAVSAAPDPSVPGAILAHRVRMGRLMAARALALSTDPRFMRSTFNAGELLTEAREICTRIRWAKIGDLLDGDFFGALVAVHHSLTAKLTEHEMACTPPMVPPAAAAPAPSAPKKPAPPPPAKRPRFARPPLVFDTPESASAPSTGQPDAPACVNNLTRPRMLSVSESETNIVLSLYKGGSKAPGASRKRREIRRNFLNRNLDRLLGVGAPKSAVDWVVERHHAICAIRAARAMRILPPEWAMAVVYQYDDEFARSPRRFSRPNIPTPNVEMTSMRVLLPLSSCERLTWLAEHVGYLRGWLLGADGRPAPLEQQIRASYKTAAQLVLQVASLVLSGKRLPRPMMPLVPKCNEEPKDWERSLESAYGLNADRTYDAVLHRCAKSIDPTSLSTTFIRALTEHDHDRLCKTIIARAEKYLGEILDDSFDEYRPSRRGRLNNVLAVADRRIAKLMKRLVDEFSIDPSRLTGSDDPMVTAPHLYHGAALLAANELHTMAALSIAIPVRWKPVLEKLPALASDRYGVACKSIAELFFYSLHHLTHALSADVLNSKQVMDPQTVDIVSKLISDMADAHERAEKKHADACLPNRRIRINDVDWSFRSSFDMSTRDELDARRSKSNRSSIRFLEVFDPDKTPTLERLGLSADGVGGADDDDAADVADADDIEDDDDTDN